MKILFFADNFPPEVNAAATRVYERAVYWAKWGHDVTFITSAPNFPQGKVYKGYKNKWHQTEQKDGIKITRVKTFIAKNTGFVLRILDFISYMIMAFFSGLFQKKPDVICVTSPQFFAAIGAWACAKCRRVPFVFELSDIWPKSILAVGKMKKSLIFKLLEKIELYLYRQSAAVIALTHAFKDDLIARGIPKEKIVVIRNGVDLMRYQPIPKNQILLQQYNLKDKFIVGYIGTHGAAHGLINVIHAAEKLKADPNIVFILVGDGAEKPMLSEEVAKRSLTNVLLLPPVAKKDIKQYWSLCDLALVHLKNNPIFSEVIPSKIFEAMGMEIPIVFVGPDGEASQIIRDTGCGFVSEYEMLSEEVTMASQDPAFLNICKRNALEKKEKFTREKQAADFLRVCARAYSHDAKCNTSETQAD